MVSRPSITAVLSTLFIAYVFYSLCNIYKIYYPSKCVSAEKCIYPSWTESSNFHMTVFVSVSKKPSERSLSPIWSSGTFNIATQQKVELNITLPKQTLRNGSLYMHAILMESHKKTESKTLGDFDLSTSSWEQASLTKFMIPKDKEYNLLNLKDENSASEEKLKTQKAMTHWIPRFSIHVMSELMPLHGIPQELYSYFKFNRRKQYLPMLFLDHFGILEKDFLPVNASSHTMPLELTFVPVSYGKMRLMVLIEQSLMVLENAGFSDKEKDDIKAVFFDTNIYLLLLTFIVSGFHLLFDILAFKNDISFWRHRESVVGLSLRSIIWRCISQSIVFVYLYDQGTSLLILVPAAFSILLELWKINKSLKLNVYFEGYKPKFEFGTSTAEEKQSDLYDSQGMKYLTFFIVPCCLSYAAYSLLFVSHTGWYSWLLESIVSGVYAFGFIFMMPQLFVNYKLKSVAHLPWRTFMYKAFNTVVDDLFAFIITMPVAHRIACFRDDIVFVIYLYQRWLYPVDKTRISEGSDVNIKKEQ